MVLLPWKESFVYMAEISVMLQFKDFTKDTVTLYTTPHSENFLCGDQSQSNDTEIFCLAQHLASTRSWGQNECWLLVPDEQSSFVQVSCDWSLLLE